jgi:hypothetical protein
VKRLFASLFVCLVLCLSVSAHPGRTDGKGGHTNHSTGEYHYHHGMSAHQHPGGVCPHSVKKQKKSEEASNVGIGISVALAATIVYLYFKK